MRQAFRRETAVVLAALFLVVRLVAAQPGCQTQTAYNPIAANYPLNITGVANGSLSLIPFGRDVADSFLPEGFGFVGDAYQRQSGWRTGSIPLLVRALYVHDIRSPDDMWRRPHTVISFELPFVDALRDGKTPFRYVHTQLIQAGNPNYAVDVATRYGVPHIIPSVFEPECDAYAYQQRASFRRGEALRGIPADGSGRAVDVVAPRQLTREARPFGTDTLKRIATQPRFGIGGEGIVCGRTTALYGEQLGFEAVVETKGLVSVSGRFAGLDVLQGDGPDGPRRESVYGIRGASAFVDADFVNCKTLQHEVE